MLQAYGLDLEAVKDKFCSLDNDIRLIYFKRDLHCPHCASTQKLLERIASISPKIKFEVYNYATNEQKDREYQILSVPAVAVIGAKDYGIRHYGFPHGPGLNDFLDDIVFISKGKNTLQPEEIKKLASIKNPIHLKLFLSPNCLYSLPVAKLALKLAVASDLISVDLIYAEEFLELAEKYHVRGIPMTVINDRKSFYGAWDLDEYLEHVLDLNA